jgi:hypothetical protein
MDSQDEDERREMVLSIGKYLFPKRISLAHARAEAMGNSAGV